MVSRTAGIVFASLCLPLAASAQSAQSSAETRDPAGLRRLQSQTGGAAVVTVHKATGGTRVVRLQPGTGQALAPGAALTLAAKQEQSRAFFRDYGALLGISSSASMDFDASSTDALGETHLTWRQTYRGVPVFAGMMRTHFARDGRLKAVTGTAIPDLSLDPAPSITSRRASAAAMAFVRGERGDAPELRIGTVRLYVYREGLAQGVPGENHLAWQIEVTDGAGIRDLVYVGAHTGKVIDRHEGIQDDLKRRAYDGHDLAFAPANYPHGAYWLEGQSFPTASTEANNMITASKETYDFFKQAFDRDSFDGEGATLDAIFDRGYGCPNASWNGTFISFCPGFTTDDVTTHEWGHAYTQYTHDLIYQWQPGALNEAYSDIWGEVVDLINNRGHDAPGGARTANSCSTFSPPVGRLQVNSPATIAGSKFAQSAQFGPALTETGVTGDVVAALDPANAAGPSTSDACSPLTNAAAVAGKIALVDRGTCVFVQKVLNAQNAGAIGVIVANNVSSGLPGMGAAEGAELVTIPSLGILQSDGTAIRSALSSGVNATLLAQPGTDASVRWLLGEDLAPGGTGAIRDMHNPTCYSNPGKVTDVAYYVCSTGDAGGVHTNSGIPNHAFALLVDGGTYNGQTVASIGLTKAAHIYYRAQSVYQHFDSDFFDHADALEMSCSDLLGAEVRGLWPGAPSEVIADADCEAVSNAIAAVELRTPAPCSFAPLLSHTNLPMCSPSTTSGAATSIFSATFETSNDSFEATTIPTGSTFSAREWTRVSSLPGGRTGAAFFAPEPNSSCTSGDDSGLLQLTSPDIVLPEATVFPRATFEHWVATEPRWDGGNLKVSVNGGAWQLVPPSAYTFNGYNRTLVPPPDNTNPIAGQPAWSGNDNGTVNGGSWGRTHVDLARFARAGDHVRLRWEFGTDLCAGRTGWYVDNVDVFSCVPKIPAITANDLEEVEGDSGKRVISFRITLDTATITPVSVNYAFADGTATHGEDFLPPDSGVIVIPAGSRQVSVGITLKGDTIAEPDEVLYLNLSGAVNATIAKAQAVATIVNDDPPRTPEP